MAATIDNRVAELERANAQLRRQLDACSAELKEARDQQTATAEVLQVINSSPGDLTPVFDAILDKGLHLCEAAFGTLWTFDSECFHAVALRRVPAGFAEVLTRAPYRPEAGSAHERLLRGAPYAQIDDAAAEASIGPVRRALVELGGAHTVIAVPLLKDGAVLGAISAFRQEVRLFTDKQIALLQNFAAQAVIAMKNARLLTETREALEQQTATAEVLQVINSSPGELAPVFDAVIENSMRLCEATQGHLYIYADGQIHAEALRGEIQFIEWQRRRGSHPVTPGSPTERALRGEQIIHIADATQIETYRSSPAFKELIDRSGIHTGVTVALRRDEAFLGTINVYRQEVRPFTDKQIALLQNFAAQAVIAMENARLLGELRERTEDLQESLEYQTATSDVLKVISHSGAELQPVFDTLVETAARICAADTAAIMRLRDGMYRLETGFGVSEEWKDLVARHPVEPGRGSVTALVALERRVVHIEDTATDPEYGWKEAAQIGRFRTALGVPLMRGDTPIGVIALGRLRVEPFTERQIELVRTFADQAVIAMENARLITETREALEQQTATAEVLQVINSSPGDLAPVFDGMLEKAMRLCRIALGALELHENGKFRAVAVRGVSGPLAELLGQPFEPPPESPLARLIAGEKVVQITDMSELARLRPDDPRAQAGAQYGLHTALFVPLRKDADLLGQIVAFRKETLPFSEKEIALLQNFAAQAVIAMENARLLTETREALEQQTATAEVLQVINSSPGDLAPVFDAMLERAVRLCEFDFSSLWTFDGTVFRPVARHGVPERFWQYLQAHTPPPFARVVAGERLVHIPDVQSIPALMQTDFGRGLLELGIEPPRSLLIVSLRKDDALLGVIVAYRHEVRPFSDKQIALLQNFAAQAVIAMENARLITETREALERQTATAEVLQVINSSPGDLAPVFDAMLDKAMRLCGVDHAALELYDGERMHAVAVHGASDMFAEALREGYPATESPAARALLEGGRFVEIADAAQIDHVAFRTAAEVDGIRTVLFVPLRRDDALLGMFGSARREVRPFSEKEIALVENFAAQAVIAMENARLITETREALERQTATAEVLQVINSSPGDFAPVFDSILEKAHSLCGVAYGSLELYDGERFRSVAEHGLSDSFASQLRQGYRASDSPATQPLLAGNRFTHIADAAEVDFPIFRSAAELEGIRTVLFVPLRRDDALLGMIACARREVRPFSEKEIALLENFAAQAVIAMENARLLTETREALEQQTATAEVLQVINSSPGDLAPVFDAILEKAHTLCGAAHGSLTLAEGEHFRAVAMRGMPERFAEVLRRPFHAGPLGEQLMSGKPFVQIADIATDELTAQFATDNRVHNAAIGPGGVRTLLAVPLRRDGALLGYITANRQEVRPFSDKQIALLQNFAAQAVIAMENARLITETREALEQQTATAEVLQVINSSPGDLAPVFDAMLEKATRLCEAPSGILRTWDGGRFHFGAVHGDPQFCDWVRRRGPVRTDSDASLLGRIQAGERVVHITNAQNDEAYRASAGFREMAEASGIRSAVTVALHKDDALLGIITVYRQEVRPFSDKQIALLQNFAAQAVIAIENARLVNDLRQRTHDLQESLEYQTATSDVLKVISQSASELASVLDTVVETATRICEGANAIIFRLRDGKLYLIASYGVTADYRDFLINHPHVINRGTLVGRTASEQQVVHITDVATDPEYTFPESQQLGALHTMLGVPLIREGALIGVLALNRKQVEPFTNKQITLVTTFADQAVIAIENARLFNELRQRTDELGRSVEELKMLGEVGRAVSSTLDLRAVLSTILTASLGMTWATAGAIFRYIRAERAFRLVEAVGWDEALLGSVSDLSIAETETLMSEAALQRTPIQLTDLAELPSTRLRDASLAAGLRSVLIVPLVGPERIFGALVLQRREAGEFPAETVRLMQTLASQSVLAIQNARLFREIADKSEQLALASQHKSQFLANMSHELRTPLNAILGYAELLVDGIYGVLPEKAQGVLERVQNNGKHLLALINDVLDLAKIEAGQLALTLEDYALAEVVGGVVTATEPLAAAKGLKFTAIVQEGMPMAHGDARRVSQVLLNLAGNAIKFTDQGEVAINASAANGQFVLTVRDTGPGIADADQERIFGEFQQIDNSDTRKKGGTGLGLAISKRMVEMQGGMISVDSVLGAGSTFRVVLPVHVEPALEEAA